MILLPRPKLKGDAIAIRLPVHVDDVFQWEASEAGMTARDLAARILEEWVANRTKKSAAAAAASHTGRASTTGAAALANEFFGDRS